MERSDKQRIQAHQHNDTLKIVPREANSRTIDSKWVFKVVKNQSTDKGLHYKARLCARGFMQKEGLDYKETFSPVVRYDSLRVLLAYITHEDMEMASFDVSTAFLYGELEERILMEVLEGVLSKSEESSSAVCVLNKSLYGLKQAPRCCNMKFKKFLSEFSFKECEADGYVCRRI